VVTPQRTQKKMTDATSATHEKPIEKDDEDDEEDNQANPETRVGMGGHDLPLSSLSLQQLNQLRQQLSAECQGLSRNVQQLQDSSARFQTSSDTLGMIEKECKLAEDITGAAGGQKKMLVPLSQSVYIDGFVAKPNEVLFSLFLFVGAPDGSRDFQLEGF